MNPQYSRGEENGNVVDPAKQPDRGAKVIGILTAVGSLIGVLLAWLGDNSEVFNPPGGQAIEILPWAAPFVMSLLFALIGWFKGVKPKVTPVSNPAKMMNGDLVKLVPAGSPLDPLAERPRRNPRRTNY